VPRSASLVLASALVLVAAVGAQNAKKDLDALQGEWKPEKAQVGGVEAPPEVTAKMTARFKGDVLTIRHSDDPAKFKLNPTKQPAEIDLFPIHHKETLLGIYELSGDTLKLCITAEGGPRPTKFESPAKSKIALFVFKRAKQ
jgi:uncharacterized protein (TIGR03067 family)